MTKELTELLSDKIKQSVRLHEINDLADKLRVCYQQAKISDSEYTHLLDIYKDQLKIVLDFNLLPDRQFIDVHVKNYAAQGVVKIDEAEMVLEELQVIEQEAIRLNGARLEYIQDNFFIDSDAVNSRKKAPPPNNSIEPNNSIDKILKRLTSLFKSRIFR